MGADGPKACEEIDALFDELQPKFDAMGVSTGYLVTTLGTTGYLIEPVFFLRDERFEIHEATIGRAYSRRLPKHAANPGATALVVAARERILDIFELAGAAHFQIGRTYRFAATRDPFQLSLLKAVKSALDPRNRMNPGVLGL